MVDITERLRLNEDDWLFGNTARTARREITTLREKLRVAEDCLIEYESREVDSGNLRGGIAAVALRQIQEE